MHEYYRIAPKIEPFTCLRLTYGTEFNCYIIVIPFMVVSVSVYWISVSKPVISVCSDGKRAESVVQFDFEPVLFVCERTS